MKKIILLLLIIAFSQKLQSSTIPFEIYIERHWTKFQREQHEKMQELEKHIHGIWLIQQKDDIIYGGD